MIGTHTRRTVLKSNENKIIRYCPQPVNYMVVDTVFDTVNYIVKVMNLLSVRGP